MSKQPLTISEEAWAFFTIQEKLNTHTTQIQIMEKDLEMNSEFRIKWPRGLLGSLPR
jgi:hypothetical protein